MAFRGCVRFLLLVSVLILSTESSSGQAIFTTTCENAKADVIFVLDSSGSVRLNNFRKMLDFIRGIIQMFNVGLDYMRVGLVRFNSGVIPEFTLDQYTHPESLLEALAMVEYTTGTTNMAGALRHVRKESYKPENGGRWDARRLAILISDGRSDNRVWTVNEAEKCKELNITLFALGIGSKVDRDELQDVGSDPDSQHVIFFDDFDALNGTQITIANTVCTYSKPKPVEEAVQAIPPTGPDGGMVAGVVFGVLICLCLILAYPGYLLAKKYVFKKKRKKKAKRPKTAAKKHRGKGKVRPRTSRPKRPSSRISDSSSSTREPRSHTHTPLRPGSSSLQRKDSYGSFDAGSSGRYSDTAPLRPLSRSSDSSGSTIPHRPGTSTGSSRRSSAHRGPSHGTLPEGPPGSEGSGNLPPGSKPLPPGLERAISMMRRQKTMTQHPAPGMAPGAIPPPGMMAREGTMMRPRIPAGAMRPPPPGMMVQREGTMGGPPPTRFFRGPPPPSILQRDGTIMRPPPPGMMMRREGTMTGPPPPGMMIRREGSTVAPPPGAFRREGTMAGPPQLPMPPGVKRENSSLNMAPPPKRDRTISGSSETKREHQSIPEESADAIVKDQPAVKKSRGAAPRPPGITQPNDDNKPSTSGLLGMLPPLGPGRLKKMQRPDSGIQEDDAPVDPIMLATRLKNLEEEPVPTVVSRGGGADVMEDAV